MNIREAKEIVKQAYLKQADNENTSTAGSKLAPLLYGLGGAGVGAGLGLSLIKKFR